MANWKLLALTVIGGGALVLGSLSTTACTAEAEATGGAAGDSGAGGESGSAGSAGAAAGSAGSAGSGTAGGAGSAGSAGGAGAAANSIVEAFKDNTECHTCIQAMTGMSADGMTDCGAALAKCDGGKCDETATCFTDYQTGHKATAKADALLSCAFEDCQGVLTSNTAAQDFLICLSEKCTTQCKTTKGFEPTPAAADCGTAAMGGAGAAGAAGAGGM